VPSDPAAFDQELLGRVVTGVRRRGKLLLVELVASGARAVEPGEAPAVAAPTGEAMACRDPAGEALASKAPASKAPASKTLVRDAASGTTTGAAVLAIHLGMSGQLLLDAPSRPGALAGAGTRPAHTQLELVFAGGAALRFVDPRRFGWFALAPADEAESALPQLGRLGAEPLDPAFSPDELARLLAGRRARLKSWLLDQHRLAGIGNIYSDEILFAARLRFDRTGAGLSPRELRRLHRSIRDVLEAAIAARGSSLADAQYRDLGGQPGTFQLQHAVYGRAGAPCIRCGRPIRRAVVGGRSSFFCPRCQR